MMDDIHIKTVHPASKDVDVKRVSQYSAQNQFKEGLA